MDFVHLAVFLKRKHVSETGSVSFYLKTETDQVSETLCLKKKLVDGQSP
jgi:hypothetical protein